MRSVRPQRSLVQCAALHVQPACGPELACKPAQELVSRLFKVRYTVAPRADSRLCKQGFAPGREVCEQARLGSAPARDSKPQWGWRFKKTCLLRTAP